jgi:hypothetical protein
MEQNYIVRDLHCFIRYIINVCVCEREREREKKITVKMLQSLILHINLARVWYPKL